MGDDHFVDFVSISKQTGLNESLLRDIIDQICLEKPLEKIILYGSRATGNFNKTSDIDLAVIAPNWNKVHLSRVKAALDDQVQTPLKFDCVWFDDLSNDKLKQEILTEGIVLYDG